MADGSETTVALVRIRGWIDYETAANIQSQCIDALQSGVGSIRLDMSSTGGDNQAGLTIAALIKALSVPVHAHNAGIVQSIALPIFLSADTKTADPDSVFKAHGFTWNLGGGIYSYSELEDFYLSLNSDMKRYMAFCRGQMKPKYVEKVEQALRGKTFIWDSGEALRAGIIKSISRQ